MKASVFLIFIIIGNFSASAWSAECNAKDNVRDYFIALALSKFEITDDNKGALKSKIEVKNAIETLDIKNGYLELQNKSIVTKISAAIFVEKGASRVIAVLEDGVSVQNAHAFVCKDGNFIDVSKIFFPAQPAEKIAELYKKNHVQIDGKFQTAEELKKVAHSLVRFKLPRKGKEVSVYSSHPNQIAETLLYKYIPSSK